MVEGVADRFRRDGFLFPIPVLDDQEASTYRRRVLRDWDDHHGSQDFGDWTYYKPYLVFDWYDQLAHHPSVLDAVEAILGPDLLLWGGTLAVKMPQSPNFFGWHQDATYWPLQPPNAALSVWLALDDADPSNGCMRYLPGSHLSGPQDHVQTYAAESLLRRGQELVDRPDHHPAIDVQVRAGEMALHHCLLVHGSEANTSDRTRIALTMVYLPAHARCDNPQETALVVRGSDRFGHFGPERRPTGNLEPQGIAEHQRVLQLMAGRRVRKPF